MSAHIEKHVIHIYSHENYINKNNCFVESIILDYTTSGNKKLHFLKSVTKHFNTDRLIILLEERVPVRRGNVRGVQSVSARNLFRFWRAGQPKVLFDNLSLGH